MWFPLTATFVTGILLGATVIAAREPSTPAPVQQAVPDCTASETAAERCNAVALTCLSYQVQMIVQIEKLSNKCVGSP